MAKEQSSASVSSIAARGLKGEALTKKEIKTVCASVLTQDEKKGQAKATKKKSK